MIRYDKTVWDDGTPLTKEKLNNIENGISQVVDQINNLIRSMNEKPKMEVPDMSIYNSAIDSKIQWHDLYGSSHTYLMDKKADKNHHHSIEEINGLLEEINELKSRIETLESKKRTKKVTNGNSEN